MATILSIAGKGSELTANEYDENIKQETRAVTGNDNVVTGDNRATCEYTGSGGHTLSVPDGSTLVGAEDTGDFEVTVKHGGAGALTVGFATGNTCDGVDADLTLRPNESVKLKYGSVADDWMVIGMALPKGTAGYILRDDGTNDLPQWSLPVVDALRYRSTDINHTSSGNWVTLALNSETRDPTNALSSTTTITVPSGYTWMKVQGNVRFDSNATGVRAVRLVDSIGNNLSPGVQTLLPAGTSSVFDVPLESYWVAVVAAETYSVEALQSSGGTLAILADYTYLNVEFK